MPRMARVVVEGVPHHISQRGNDRQDVFLADEDRRSYIQSLRDRCQQHGVALLGYCLMTNHVHRIGIPRGPRSLALALGQAHWRYAMRFQRRYGRSGHLWQNHFYSCPLGSRRQGSTPLKPVTLLRLKVDAKGLGGLVVEDSNGYIYGYMYPVVEAADGPVSRLSCLK